MPLISQLLLRKAMREHKAETEAEATRETRAELAAKVGLGASSAPAAAPTGNAATTAISTVTSAVTVTASATASVLPQGQVKPKKRGSLSSHFYQQTAALSASAPLRHSLSGAVGPRDISDEFDRGEIRNREREWERDGGGKGRERVNGEQMERIQSYPRVDEESSDGNLTDASDSSESDVPYEDDDYVYGDYDDSHGDNNGDSYSDSGKGRRRCRAERRKSELRHALPTITIGALYT